MALFIRVHLALLFWPTDRDKHISELPPLPAASLSVPCAAHTQLWPKLGFLIHLSAVVFFLKLEDKHKARSSEVGDSHSLSKRQNVGEGLSSWFFRKSVTPVLCLIHNSVGGTSWKVGCGVGFFFFKPCSPISSTSLHKYVPLSD